MTTLYVVAVSQWTLGDIAGCLVVAEPEPNVLWSHVSSSMGWLRRDLTTGFDHRAAELADLYPDGYDVLVVGLDDPMPDAIASLFASAEPVR